MKKLFLDTNIILDLLANRMPFYTEAAELFSLADKKEIKLSISSLCLADTHYILSKQNHDLEVRKILRKFKVLVNVLPLDDTAIENDQDILITRNQQYFRDSKIPVMTAGEFIKSIE
jgi:predicted nucleic acid-binding protein